MSDPTVEELDEIIAVLQQFEADVSATIEQMHAAGFSSDEQVPSEA
jgi:hypothetical protein